MINIKSKFTSEIIGELIGNTLLLSIFLTFAYISFLELSRHIMIRDMGNGETIVEFTLSNPTVVNFIIGFVSIACIYASLRIFFCRIFAADKSVKKYWIILLVGFLICVSAGIIGALHFLSNASMGPN